ncbi:uncharacterized protein LOC120891455 isoform X2 [Ictidomys tridecemlineatus]
MSFYNSVGCLQILGILLLTLPLRPSSLDSGYAQGFKKEDNFVPWPVPPAPFNSNQSVGRQLLWGGKQLCSTLHHDDPLHHMPRDNEASQPWMEPFETMSQRRCDQVWRSLIVLKLGRSAGYHRRLWLSEAQLGCCGCEVLLEHSLILILALAKGYIL